MMKTETAKTREPRSLVGRQRELEILIQLLSLGRHVLVEGPVGVGKTFLVVQALRTLGRKYERVDGDARYTEAKLTGWFDPPLVLKQGYSAETFIEGPLVRAMRLGQVLFINELNRMPEGVQNILLPAMDEGKIQLPKLGEVQAKAGFGVVGTQNPKEFTGTHSLSEALLDRFELLPLRYQSRDEELQILRQSLGKASQRLVRETAERATDLVRSTREHSGIRRGASIRAGQAICELVAAGLSLREAALLALPGRVELVSGDTPAEKVIEELLGSDNLALPTEKKRLQ